MSSIPSSYGEAALPAHGPLVAARPEGQKPAEVLCVVGARPNFIKMASVITALNRTPGFVTQLLHTGQHFSPEMSQTFFDELELPRPDLNLNVGGGSHTVQTAEIMKALEIAIAERRPQLILVVGDVNSTMAAALVGAKMGVPIAHVESGLRSFDRTMPEEVNRIVTDALSDYLFVSERSGVTNLLAEGVDRKKIFLVGNVMIDTLLRFREKAARSTILETLGLAERGYAVATLHRPSNVDEPEKLAQMMGLLEKIAGRLPVVFPVHPRTRGRIEAAGITSDGVLLTPPLGYLDFLRLVSGSRLVLTDSGGIQEETTVLGVPCLTMRENTERPVTIDVGTNLLVGTQPDRILAAAYGVLDGKPRKTAIPEYWDGKTGERIARILADALNS